jgi:hypothetical protein
MIYGQNSKGDANKKKMKCTLCSSIISPGDTTKVTVIPQKKQTVETYCDFSCYLSFSSFHDIDGVDTKPLDQLYTYYLNRYDRKDYSQPIHVILKNARKLKRERQEYNMYFKSVGE